MSFSFGRALITSPLIASSHRNRVAKCVLSTWPKRNSAASAAAETYHSGYEDARDETNVTPEKSPLTPELRKFLDGALRVNQAGELAAVLIYSAQTPPLVQSNPQLRNLMKHMYDQEAGHFKTFN